MIKGRQPRAAARQIPTGSPDADGGGGGGGGR